MELSLDPNMEPGYARTHVRTQRTSSLLFGFYNFSTLPKMRKRTGDSDLCVTHNQGKDQSSYVTSSFPVGIYVFNKSGFPELLGTGFFVRYDRALFLVTAYHLVKEIIRTGGGFGVGCNFKILPLSFDVMLTCNDPNNIGIYDDRDIAAFCVSPSDSAYADYLKCAVAHHQSIDGLWFADGVAYCYFTGLPVSKNKPKRDDLKRSGAIVHHMETFEYKISNTSALVQLHKSPANHIALNWTKKNRENANSAHPRGCSGAPVWFVKRRDKDMGIYLTGVFIEFHKREKILVFTRIERLYDLLDEQRDRWRTLRNTKPNSTMKLSVAAGTEP